MSSRRTARGFVLLEAMLALLIIAGVAIGALECVRIMSSSIERMRLAQEAARARQNAMALTRHLLMTKHKREGEISYGRYSVRWRTTEQRPFNAPVPTPTGLVQDRRIVLYKLTVETTHGDRTIDTFEMRLAGY